MQMTTTEGNSMRNLPRLIYICFIFLFLLALVGYGLNIYKLTQLDFEKPYKSEVLRSIGILPPIGAVIGWIDIDDTKPGPQLPVTE